MYSSKRRGELTVCVHTVCCLVRPDTVGGGDSREKEG